jgi:hypothetical protein
MPYSVTREELHLGYVSSNQTDENMKFKGLSLIESTGVESKTGVGVSWTTVSKSTFQDRAMTHHVDLATGVSATSCSMVLS